MIKNSPKNNPKFEDEVKSAVVGEKNIIYNYFYYREDVKDKLVESEETAVEEKLPCPYRGLFHFGPKDAEIFFGREVFVEKLFQATKARNFIPVLGASGSGKSSVVLAGLVPKLEQEGNWKFTHFRPSSGNDPFYALAEALVPLYRSDLDSTDRMTQADKLAKSLSEEELSLAKVFSNIQRQHPNHKVLLIVDQFEELYTQYSDLNFRHRFLDCLLSSFQSSNSGASSSIVLVTTMRADFLANALSYRPFADMLQNADIKLGAMSREELTEVIEKPAQLRGVWLESGLTERILEAVEKEPGNLPLLEFSLTLLWAKQQDGQLTHQAYEEIGGVEKALAEYAERQYESLSYKDRKRAEQVFIQLVRPGDGTEDTRRLATRDEVGQDNWDLITRLASARLMVTNKNEKTEKKERTDQDTVEIIHEALIWEWGSLRSWIEENRDFRLWQERLRVGRQQWEISGCDEEALLRGRLLLEAEDKLQKHSEELTAEQGFITASVELREKEKEKLDRQRKRTITLLKSGLVGALGLAAVAGVGWWFATIAATNDRIKTLALDSQFLLDLVGINEYRGNVEEPTPLLDYDYSAKKAKEIIFGEASLKAIKAGREMQHALGIQTETRFQVLESLRRVIATKEEPKSVRLSECDPMKRGLVSLTWTSDRKKIACVNYDGTVRLYDGTVRLWDNNIVIKPSIFQGETEWVDDVVFSPDGKMIASGTANGTVNLWERATGKKIRELKGYLSQVRDISFSPNDQILAANDADSIIVWDVATGRELKTLSLSCSILGNSIVFSPNGQFLLAYSVDRGFLKLCDIKTGDEIQTFFLKESASNINFQFSPDSQTIIYSADKDVGRKSVIKFWNIAKKSEIKEIILPGKAFLSPDGKTIAVIDAKDNKDNLYGVKGELSYNSSERTVSLWDTSTGKKVKTLSNFPPGELAKISFSPDSSLIAVYAYDNRGGKNLGPVIGSKAKVTFWKRDGTRLKTIEQLGEIFQVNFSPDGKKVAIASFGPPPNSVFHIMLNLWEVSTGRKLKTLINEPIIFSPKGISAGLETKFSSDGKIIVAVHSSGIAQFFDSSTGTEINLANISPSREIEIGQRTSKISGKNILTLRKDGSLRVRVPATGREFNVNRYDSTLVSAARISSDNKRITTVNWHGKLQQRNLVTGQVLKEINLPFDEFASSIKFSPDGRYVAAARANYTVKIWDADTGKEINNFKENLKIFDEANDWRRDEVFFSPNGKIVAVFRKPSSSLRNDTEKQGKLELWELSKENSLPVSKEMTSGVKDISFHPQDSVLAVLRPGNIIQLWNLSSGKLEKTIKPALDNVNRIQFNRDGKLLFAINYREIKILSARSRREISSFKKPAGISLTNPSVDFSADGKTLILQSDNRFVFLNFNLESLLKRSCEITRYHLKNNLILSEEDKHICD